MKLPTRDELIALFEAGSLRALLGRRAHNRYILGAMLQRVFIEGYKAATEDAVKDIEREVQKIDAGHASVA